MPIHFKSSPVSEPFIFDSIGNRWIQEPVVRSGGYPLYHYLQTEAGCGQFEIAGREYVVREGEGILIAPFVRHSYRGLTPWQTAFATFTGTLEGSIGKMVGSRPFLFTEKETGARINGLISQVMAKYEHPPADEQDISTDCYRLLLLLAGGGSAADLAADPLYARYVSPVIQEIETNYGRELTVQALCRQVYVTPQYLSRLFRRFLGCSAYEYLTSYRINKARELLLTSQRTSIQEIGRRVGFQDASHFIAMFKKATGMTPLEFRRIN